MAERGSKGGIVVALVVFVILFFVAGIFAVVKSTDANKYQKSLDDLTKRYQAAISTSEVTSPEVQALKGQGGTAWDSLLRQRNETVRLIVGKDPATANASEEATKAFTGYIEDANKQLAAAKANSTIPAGSVKDAMSAMVQAVAQKAQDVNALNTQLTDSNNKLQQATEAYNAGIAEMRQKVAQADAAANAAQEAATKYKQEKDAQLAQIQQQLVAMVDQAGKSAEQLNLQLAGRGEEVNKLTKQLRDAVLQIQQTRPNNTSDSVIRRADGHIIELGRGDVVYVDLGSGMQVSPGMTFQIYDRNEGIPRIGAEADQLPPGKGSLEIVRVAGTSSEARILKREPGQAIQQGDMIGNLIYDPNVKLAFKIYGNFDIDQNGVATAQEADVLKRLVTQWGGINTEEVNIATDFVVLGKEPVVGEKPADDDPIALFNWQKSQKALEEYQAVRDRALELHIPVLNQNRFLYFIGYFDQARK